MGEMYFQCRLERVVECVNGRTVTAVTVGWIPQDVAREGYFVQLLSEDDEMWEVVEVFTPGMERAALHEKQARDRGCLPSIAGR